MAEASAPKPTPPRTLDWPIFRSFSGWTVGLLPRDLAVGLTLAAIAIPEQMATSRLSGFPPEIGLYVFVAGALGFAVFGANRFLSAGADSTIAPIFAGGLALLAATGSPHYAALAAALAVAVGLLLIGAGMLRMGWIANLLSVPVTTGFLAGIAIHIAASQLPALLSLPEGGGNVLQQLWRLAATLGRSNLWTVAIGIGVLAATFLAENLSPRIPGALIGLAAATGAVLTFDLERRGVSVLGVVAGGLPRPAIPAVDLNDLIHLAPLTLLVSIVVMVQTSATTRGFTNPSEEPDIDRDFIGVGAAGLFAGLVGGFPANASPPRTAIVSEAGGRSQAAGLLAAAVILVLAVFGPSLMRHVPNAALAGILLFVALRITRVGTIRTVLRQSYAEFSLIVATFFAMTILPIQTGVAVGVILSLLHGVYTITRARVIVFEHEPGTSVWWPLRGKPAGEQLSGVLVVGFQAPLSFLNAYDFRRGVHAMISKSPNAPSLLVLEAGSIVEIDFTAAQTLLEIIDRCANVHVTFAIARLESVRAQDGLRRFGVLEKLGANRVFHSVDEAVRTLRPIGK